jgi:hypothetical protein
MVNIVSSAIGVGIAAKQPKGRTISDYPLPKRLASTSSIRQGGKQLKAAGVGPTEIARKVGISRTSVFRILSA